MTNRTASLAALVVMSGALAGSAPPAMFQDLSAIPDNTWVRLNAVIPTRSGGAEVYWAYDATNRVIVHYGGCTSPYTNEQWNFSLETRTWTMKYPHDPNALPNRPAGGCSRGMAYDSKRGLVWINGTASNGGIGAGDGKLWSYNAVTNVWTKPPENWIVKGRYDATFMAANSMAYDSVNDLIISIGRVPAGATVGDVHVYDPQRGTWNAKSYDPVVNGTGYCPTTFDPDLAQFVFFTGSRIWTYNAATDVWTQKAAGPPGSRNHVGMTYDSRNKVHIMFGGRGGSGDTWAYDARTDVWTNMNPAQSPTLGAENDTMLFSYIPQENVHIYADYRPGSALWAYRYSSSGTPPPTTTPPPTGTPPPSPSPTPDKSSGSSGHERCGCGMVSLQGRAWIFPLLVFGALFIKSRTGR